MSTVLRDQGPSGLPIVVVRTPHGGATIFEHGAHVTSWVPAGSGQVLWLSSLAGYAPDVAIRGGVPICFPWFGSDPHGDGPAHGYARLRDWTLERTTTDDDGAVSLLCTLPETLRRPNRLAASYRVTVGRALRLELTVRNADVVPATFEAALHTYLQVSDVRNVTVRGLEDAPYVDDVAGGAAHDATGEPLRLTGRTDRVYEQPGRVTVDDSGADRAIRVTSEGSTRAVVWNPWAELAAGMADMGEGEWTSMLCVETAAVGDGAITLPPGATHTMSAVIEVVRR